MDIYDLSDCKLNFSESSMRVVQFKRSRVIKFTLIGVTCVLAFIMIVKSLGRENDLSDMLAARQAMIKGNPIIFINTRKLQYQYLIWDFRLHLALMYSQQVNKNSKVILYRKHSFKNFWYLHKNKSDSNLVW